MSKVRIYDLAKELKLESKKILEDARRMGVDVSVPSNTLEDNIAAKIREMYYPKKEQAPAIHKARLIKHQIAPGAPAEQPSEAPAVVERAQQAPRSAEAELPARPSPLISQTTIKPITPPKPVSSPPAAKPSPPAAQAQQQSAAPVAEQKSKVIKLAPPPAQAPAQAPEVDVEQAAPPADPAAPPAHPAAPPAHIDEEPVAAPQVEEIEEGQVKVSARAVEAAPVAKPQAPAAPSK